MNFPGMSVFWYALVTWEQKPCLWRRKEEKLGRISALCLWLYNLSLHQGMGVGAWGGGTCHTPGKAVYTNVSLARFLSPTNC